MRQAYQINKRRRPKKYPSDTHELDDALKKNLNADLADETITTVKLYHYGSGGRPRASVIKGLVQSGGASVVVLKRIASDRWGYCLRAHPYGKQDAYWKRYKYHECREHCTAGAVNYCLREGALRNWLKSNSNQTDIVLYRGTDDDLTIVKGYAVAHYVRATFDAEGNLIDRLPQICTGDPALASTPGYLYIEGLRRPRRSPWTVRGAWA